MRIKNSPKRSLSAENNKTSEKLKKIKSLMDSGDLSAAEKGIQKLLKKEPDNLEIQHTYGIILYLKKEYVESIKILSNVVEKIPDAINLKLNYGAALFGARRYEEAVEQYKKILKVAPNHVIALNNIGGIYKLLMRMPEAQKTLERSIELDPNYHIAQFNLGSVYFFQKKFNEAEKQFRKSLEIKFTVKAYYSLLSVCNKTNPEEAYDLAVKATKLENPGIILLAAFQAFSQACDWEAVNSIQDEVMKMIARGGSDSILGQSILFILNKMGSVSREKVFDIHRGWGEKISRYVDAYSEYSQSYKTNRLRIGYLSPDFRKHSVGYFFRNIISHHDKDKFEVYCYASGRHDDSVTNEIRNSCTVFAKIYNLSDKELAKKIHDDGIHILIDLAGHTENSRITVLSYKPAPIQIAYLGYPNTTGLTTVDYRITDNYAEDENEGTLYTEKLIKMPESFLCFGEFNNCAIKSDMALQRKGYITFGSFNNINKLSQETVYVWSQILTSVPMSKLIIKSPNADKDYIKNNIYKEFKTHSIHHDRIELYGFKDAKDDHLLLYNDIDIALDTFPYNGTTTTCESLWMGVPVVTLVGEKHAQRVSYSILKNIGIEDTITFTEEEYIGKAVELAANPEKLKSLRARIPTAIRESILCNPEKFTHQLEDLYRQAWVKKGYTLPEGGEEVVSANEGHHKQIQVNPEKIVNAKACLDAGSLMEAEKMVLEILEESPDDIDALFLLGTIEKNKGNYEQSARILTDVVEKAPEAFNARLNLGVALMELSRFEEAGMQFGKILEVQPENVVVLNNLGNVFKELGRYDEALSYFEKSVNSKPDFWIAFFNMGNTYIEKELYEPAMACFQEVLRHNTSPAVNTAIVNTLRQAGLVEKASGAFKIDSATQTQKQKLRLIHNLARSGATLISKCIGSMNDIVLLSEIHPQGIQYFNPLNQVANWYSMFSPEDMQSLSAMKGIDFGDTIDLIDRKSADNNKYLIVRDWAHLDYYGFPFVEKPGFKLETYEILKDRFDIVRVAITRHPIDQWLSLRRLSALEGKLDLNLFLRGYRAYAEECKKIGYIRYEDFVKDPAGTLKKLCDILEIPFDSDFINKWHEYKNITGDVTSTRGGNEIKKISRRELEKGLLEQFTSNEDYNTAIKLLNYDA